MKTRPLFVVLEGIDGAGTTTQAERLCAALESRGMPAHLTREPTTGPVGRLLREYLAGAHQPSDATTLGLLFAADRADHVLREIEPALAEGKIVVCDRYYHSSLAYQGGDGDRAWIATLNQRATRPDCTYFLRVRPEIAASRRAAADRPDELFDAKETQERVARGYEAVIADLAAQERIEVIDGEQAMDAIHAALLASVVDLAHSRGAS